MKTKIHNLKKILKSRGVKQTWLIQKLQEKGHKIDKGRMTKICQGTTPRSLKMINDICEILQIQLTDLV